MQDTIKMSTLFTNVKHYLLLLNSQSVKLLIQQSQYQADNKYTAFSEAESFGFTSRAELAR